MRYKYEYVKYWDHAFEKTMEKLNELGAEGWKVVAFFDNYIILMREVENKDDVA